MESQELRRVGRWDTLHLGILMTKENKIIKYGLEPEVDIMLDSGLSLNEICTTIKNNHSDIIDLQNLSSMSIMRYRDSKNKKAIEEQIDEGGDPVDTFLKEFNGAIRSLMQKNEKWDRRVEELWQECKDDASIIEKAKVIKEARDNREQSKKEWLALAQYGVRQTSNIYNINLKKEQNVKIMLLEWARDLCPVCKEKIFNEISKEDNVIEEVSND